MTRAVKDLQVSSVRLEDRVEQLEAEVQTWQPEPAQGQPEQYRMSGGTPRHAPEKERNRLAMWLRNEVDTEVHRSTDVMPSQSLHPSARSSTPLALEPWPAPSLPQPTTVPAARLPWQDSSWLAADLLHGVWILPEHVDSSLHSWTLIWYHHMSVEWACKKGGQPQMTFTERSRVSWISRAVHSEAQMQSAELHWPAVHL